MDEFKFTFVTKTFCVSDAHDGLCGYRGLCPQQVSGSDAQTPETHCSGTPHSLPSNKGKHYSLHKICQSLLLGSSAVVAINCFKFLTIEFSQDEHFMKILSKNFVSEI